MRKDWLILRYLKTEHIDTPMSKRPIAFIGPVSMCEDFAKKNDYRWKNDKPSLFGGYYVNNDGDCLLPDTYETNRKCE